MYLSCPPSIFDITANPGKHKQLIICRIGDGDRLI